MKFANRNERLTAYDHLFDETSNGTKKNNQLLFKLFKINFWPILLSILIYFIQFAPVISTPLIVSQIVNIVTDAIQNNVTVDWLIWRKIISLSVLMILIILNNVPATRIRFGIVSRIIRNANASVKCSVIRKLQSLSITYSKDMQTGKIQSKFLKDIDFFELLLDQLLQSIIPNIISAIVAVVVAVINSGLVGLFFLVVVPINILLSVVFKKKIKVESHDFRVHNENMGAKVTTMLAMTPVTKAHGLENVEYDNVNVEIQKVKDSAIKLDKTVANFASLNWVVNTLLSALCVVFCAILALNKFIKFGDILLYQSLFATISTYVSLVVTVYPQLAKGFESANSLSELMSANEVELNLNKGEVPSVNGLIEFKNVSYAYPRTSQEVIKNINLVIKPGECIAVVGSSGSGKTTLMNMIIGLLKPTSGDLLVDGKSINDFDLTQYRHNISVVPQTPVLFSGSIKENITYGLEKYTEEELKNAIEMANINEFLPELENGIETNVGERGEKLSGGQKQRVTIARALIRKPKIIIFDEATSALDNISEYHVQKAISSAIKGKTTFIVAHRLSTIRNADRILVMEDGRIVESGTFDELIKKQGKFYELKQFNDLNSKTAEEELS